MMFCAVCGKKVVLTKAFGWQHWGEALKAYRLLARGGDPLEAFVSDHVAAKVYRGNGTERLVGPVMDLRD